MVTTVRITETGTEDQVEREEDIDSIKEQLVGLGSDSIKDRARSFLEEIEILSTEGTLGHEEAIKERLEKLTGIKKASTEEEVIGACAVLEYRNKGLPIVFSYEMLRELEERFRAALDTGIIDISMSAQLSLLPPLTLWGFAYMAYIMPVSNFSEEGDYEVDLSNLHAAWSGVVAGHILFERYGLEQSV